MISSTILADSINPQGDRLTTFKVTFPRIVLAEFNTHREFSRNSASSRAIPFNKMVKMVEENPFIPIAWQKNHKGMQGTEYITDEEALELIREEWLQARDHAILHTKRLQSGKIADEPEDRNTDIVTKQLCNRLLEAFMWHTVIITSSQPGLENFFNLRCPQYKHHGRIEMHKSKKDLLQNFPMEQDNPESWWRTINKSQAEIHIQALAEYMWDSYNESTPKQLQPGQWHLPFGDNINLSDREKWDNSKGDLIEADIKIATARCARISYETLGDNPKIDYEADIKLHDRLAQMKHASPFEHAARCMTDEEYYTSIRGQIKHGGVDYDYDKTIKVGIINHEYYPYVYPEAKQLPYFQSSEGPHPDNGNIYGWCRNFKGFIQYRHLMDL